MSFSLIETTRLEAARYGLKLEWAHRGGGWNLLNVYTGKVLAENLSLVECRGFLRGFLRGFIS